MSKTPLYALHEKLGASFISFHGFMMPLKYDSIREEHNTVRTNVGLFDVSHMGNIWVTGSDSLRFLDRMIVEDPHKIEVGKGQYTVILRDDGTIIDDEVFLRFPQGILFVPNVGMHDFISQWFQSHIGGLDVHIDQVSQDYVILAIQGPKSQEVLQKLVTVDLDKIGFFACRELASHEVSVPVSQGAQFLLSHTGYTGEKGFELQVSPPREAEILFEKILEMGKPEGIKPIGLGARDTLRMEKCFALASNEFQDGRTPLEAGLSWLINWDHDFIGKDALLQQKKIQYHRITYLRCTEKGVPRAGCLVQKNGKPVGKVSSGTISPCLNTGIAFAYLDPGYREIGTPVNIVIRGKPVKAEIVKMPFVKKGEC